MLKTFTILATVPASFHARSLEGALLDGVSHAQQDAEARVDAFEGDHTTDARMAPGGAMARAYGDALKTHKAMRTPPAPRTWADLTRDEQHRILKFANEHGGGFVSTLADAWWRADSSNAAKLGEAFGAMLLEGYGHALESKV